MVHITLYKPPSHVISHSFITAKMTATPQDELFDKFMVLLFFIELNMLFFIIISGQRRQQNPAPSQPAPQLQPQPPPLRRRKLRIHGLYLGHFKERKEDATKHSWIN